MNKTSKVIDNAFKSFSHELKDLMVNCFKSVDEVIYGIAEKTDNPIKQKQYLESLRSIRVHKLNVLTSFFKSIQSTNIKYTKGDFEFFVQPKSDSNNKTISTTYDKNDIQEKHLQNTMINVFELKLQKKLDLLRSYYGLFSKIKLTNYQLPNGPYVVVSSFAKSIRLLHLNQNIKIIIYKHFELKVMSQLEIIYTQLMDDFKKHVLKLDLTDKTSQKKTNFTITHQEIIGVLNAVQAELTKNHSDVFQCSANSLKKSILDKLSHIQLRQSRHIDHLDLYALEMMSMKFQFICDDINIPDSFQLVIIQLYIPFLKQSLFNETIFDDIEHPLNKLLNTIHSSALGWHKELDVNNKFLKKLKIIVDKIVTQDDLSAPFLAKILADFRLFLKQQENDFIHEQEKIKKRESGKAKISLAMKTVDALIAHKIENVRMPDEIKNIIMGPWKNLLSLLLVRYSDTARQYLERVNFIDDVIALLDSKHYEVVIETKIKKLVKDYASGLVLVAYNGEELDKKLEQFKDSLLKYHKLDEKSKASRSYFNDVELNSTITKKHPIVDKKFTENTAKEKRTTIKQEQESTANHSDSQQIKASNKNKKNNNAFPVGTVFEFSRFNNNSVKAHLSWINPKSGKYIFVNSQGLKVTDKTLKELLSGIEDNSIVLRS